MDRFDDLQATLDEIPARREEWKRQREQLRGRGRRLYSDDQGRPVLRRSFALYLDELGTKSRAPHLTDDQLQQSLAQQDRLASLLDSTEFWADDELEVGERFLSFSDNLVLAAPARRMPPNIDDGLFWVLFAACAYTLNLAVLGRFCRGGITVGPLYIDNSYVTGNALVEAVRIEQEVARYPRVILSDDCVELAMRELASPGEDPFDGPYNRYLLYDADGDCYIANYLAALSEDDQYDASAVPDGLQLHSRAIERAEAEAGHGEGIREKYRWLRGYHNFVATTFFDRPDLRIDGSTGALSLVVHSRSLRGRGSR